MAANFTKAQALALIQGASGSNKFLLGDEQKNEIMTFYKERSYATAYGSGLPVSSITQGSVTYTLNAGKMAMVAKTGIGQGTNGSIAAEKTGFAQKTVYLSAPQKIEGAFEEADLMQGMESAVAVKYAQALDTFNKEFERGFLKTLAATTTGALIDIDAITTADLAKAAKDQIVDAAFDLAELEDSNYAIDGFDESRIFIDLSSKLFNRLVDERLIDNEADATFKEGIFRIGTMGGFKVRRNEFLGKAGIVDKAAKVVHAIVATDVTAVSPRALVAANAGKVDNLSEDQGYYVEQKFASVDGATVSYAVMGIESLIKTFSAGK